ncbi:MAG: HD domain-containing protein [Phycisphaerales bacterium]|nr:HD domain-containing protein [Phycisphaerales bacterium]
MQEAETVTASEEHHLDIADMTPGTRVDGTYSIVNPQVSASRTGKPFLKCILRDASGRVSGRMWSVDPDAIGEVLGATFAWIEGCCENFNDQIQVKIEKIKPTKVGEMELRKLLPASARDFDEMVGELKAILDTLSQPAAKALAENYLGSETFMTRFRQAPAARTLHHAYLGGLLEHTLQLMKLADAMLPNYPELDRDIVLLGLFLHDSGKVLEFDVQKFDYTRRGNLLGHLLDGVLMLEGNCSQVKAAGGPNLPPDARLALQHIIASHHGMHHGSIKAPSTPEAVFVSQLDDLDAKSRIAIDSADRDGGGEAEFSEPIFGLDGARIYRGQPFGDAR